MTLKECNMERKKNTTVTKIWNETLKKMEKINLEISPFSRKLYNPEILDMGIQELEKKIKKSTKKGIRF